MPVCHVGSSRNPPQLPEVLLGQLLWYGQQAERQTARTLAEHLLTLAQGQADSIFLLPVHAILGGLLLFRGALNVAYVNLVRSSALCGWAYHRAIERYRRGGMSPCGLTQGMVSVMRG